VEIIGRKKLIDYFAFAESPSVLSPRHGLPQDVIYCSECVISNQRPSSVVEFKNRVGDLKPTIGFDATSVCDACNVAKIKKETDWEARRNELEALCDIHRGSGNDGYDCVVPGSGGKDSFFASHFLKYELGMSPITVTWAPHIYTDWGRRNHQAWIAAGFDNILITPNAKTHRLLTRLATELLLHPFQPFMIGQKSIAAKVAKQHGIPLIFYGENEAEYGNPLASFGSPKRDLSFSANDGAQITLGGVNLSDLVSNFGLTRSDLHYYLPLKISEVLAQKIETHYLGYYMPWHPQSCYYYAVEHGGFEASPERTPGTYSKYNSIDDKVDDFHYYTTGVKFGLGRASYDASQEVRSGDIDREEAVALVTKFDHEFPHRFSDEFFEYISLPKSEFPSASQMFEESIMTPEYFKDIVDSFRSPHLWIYRDNSWCLRHPVS